MQHGFAKDAILFLGLLAASGRAQSIDGLSSAPEPSDFLRRWSPNVALIGDYLYIDAGEISQTIDGEPTPYRHSNPVNETLSINMAESWDPKDVEYNVISKDAAIMMRQAMLVDESSDTFYVWGGQSSYRAPVPQADLWKFEADGEGGGSWDSQLPENSGDFTELRRTTVTTSVSTRDAAFIFGGGSTQYTDPHHEGPVIGFLEFNFTTQIWTNHSSGPFSESGSMRAGAAVYAPSFGPNGQVILLGGADQRAPGGESYIPMDNVTFMDPVTKEWHWQETSGDPPPSRIFHCAVGVQSPNKTFEIFVFGGRRVGAESDTGYDDMHILSLPGFVWQRAQYPSRSPRDNHACVVAGKRQLVTVGGIDGFLGPPDSWDDEDPFPQGLGIFDMVDLEWKDTFDADASDYRTPETVQEWYDDGRLDEVDWSSDDVKALFAEENQNGDGDSPSDNSGGGNDDSKDGENSSDDSGTPVGAIAGGVVGGVLGIALIGGLAWFLRRRRRRTDVHASEPLGSSGAQSDHDATSKSPFAASELHTTPYTGVEADSTPWNRHEMPAGNKPIEMDATSIPQRQP